MNTPFNISTAYCPAPWVNIHINNLLAIKPCCAWPANFRSIENYTSGTDPDLIQLKTQLANNNPPQPCVQCIERDWYSEFKEANLTVDSINGFSIESVDVRWSSTCQLNCVYCDPYSSSSWAQLISKQKVIPIEASRIRDVESVFELFSKSKVKRVSLLGGEPLLLKENLRLLEVIGEDTSIEIFTNLNVDLASNKIYQQLIKRPNVNWYVSMETVGSKFEFVRRGADWHRQVENLTQLMQTRPRSVSLQSQYCVYSAFDLVDLYAFASTFDNLHVNLVSGNFNPKHLDIFCYPKEFKELALDEITKCLDLYPDAKHVVDQAKEKLINDMDIVVPNIVEDCVAWHQNQETKFFNNRFEFTDLWTQFGKKSVDATN